jgi:hypothetical protein
MPWNSQIARRSQAHHCSSSRFFHIARLASACCIVVVASDGFSQNADPPQVAAPLSGTELDLQETDADSNHEKVKSIKPVYRNELLRGRISWLAGALKEEFGISSVPEVAQQSLALITSDGQIVPLVENIRGRAFRKDERLRDIDMQIFVRRHQKQPLAQILRIFEIRDGKRYEIDYWCDICAIPMYETGPCSCCQDDNRLRRRLVADDDQIRLESASKR